MHPLRPTIRSLLAGAPLLALAVGPLGAQLQEWTIPTTISNTQTPLELAVGSPTANRAVVLSLSQAGQGNRIDCFLVDDPYDPVVVDSGFVAGGLLFALSHGIRYTSSGNALASFVDDFGIQVISASASDPCSWAGTQGVITSTGGPYASTELRLLGDQPLLAAFNTQNSSIDVFTATIGNSSLPLVPYRSVFAEYGIAGAFVKGTRVGLSVGDGTDCVWGSEPFTDTLATFVDCANPSVRSLVDRDAFPGTILRESIAEAIGGFHFLAYTHEASGQVRVARLDPSTGVVISKTVGPAPGGPGFFGIGLVEGTTPNTVRVIWPGYDVEISTDTVISNTFTAFPIIQKGPIAVGGIGPTTSVTETLVAVGPGSLLLTTFPAQRSATALAIPSLDRWGLLALGLLLGLVAFGILRGLGRSA